MRTYETKIGKQFGIRTVLKKVENHKFPDGRSVGKFLCKCNLCGKESLVLGQNLKSGHSKSCECIEKERARKMGRKNRGESAQEATIKHIMRSYRNSAKFVNRDFLLNYDEFVKLIFSNCYYCGIEPSLCTNRYLNKDQKLVISEVDLEWAKLGTVCYNGVDRIDNNLGYITGNCVSCCTSCNSAKHDKLIEDFFKHTIKIFPEVKEYWETILRRYTFMVKNPERYSVKIDNQNIL